MDYPAAVDRLISTWQKAGARATVDVLALGAAGHALLRVKLRGIVDRGARQVARSEALRDAGAKLREAGCERWRELSRWVAVHAVAVVFGEDEARKLPLATLRAFVPLVRRDSLRETWAVRRKLREAATALWARAVAGEKSAAISAEIRTLLGRKPRPPRKKTVPGALISTPTPETVLTAIATMDADQRRAVFVVLAKEFLPRAQPVTPVIDPPVVKAEPPIIAPQTAASRIFGLRRAG